jgi:Fe-S cluster assembly protein SufB
MYKKLGISVDEQKMMNNVAMDIVVDWFLLQLLSKNLKGIIFYEYFRSY